MPYQDHVCQPFTGARGPDPALPEMYQRDPWCWTPTLGFHRSSRPLHRVLVTLHRGAKKHIHGNALSRAQLVRLGAGAGLSNSGAWPFPQNVARLVEVSDGTGAALYAKGWEDYPDAAECFARLGADLRHMTDTGAADFLATTPEAARAWIRDALWPLVYGHPALLPWRDRLMRGMGGPMDPEALAEIGRIEDAAHKSRAMWEAGKGGLWLDYNAAGAVRVMNGPDPFGAVRLVCRLVAITEPTPAETVRWWRGVVGNAVQMAGDDPGREAAVTYGRPGTSAG